MDMSLILFILAFIAVIFLIFKLIKKIVFAVITVFLFVFVVIAGVFGLVYMDYNYLTSQDEYNVNVIYSDDGNYVLGISFHLSNQTADPQTIEGLSKIELNEIDPEEIDSDSGEFIIVINDELFKSLITKDEYTIEEFGEIDTSGVNITLTKEEIISIIDAQDGFDKFSEILLDKNGLTGIERNLAKDILKERVDNELEKNGFTIKQVLFTVVLVQGVEDERNLLKLVEGFKNESLEVYPERFTFKLVRMLPVDTLKSAVEDNIPTN